MLDSRHWKSAEVASTMPFQLDGDAVPTSRTTSRRTWVSLAEGVVSRVSGSQLWIDDDVPVSLRHSISPDVDLRLLLGRRVRATLLHVAALDAGLTQTLTIAASDEAPLVIAHAGLVRGVAHTLGKTTVYVALSQRPGGPMVFGTARVQSLVRLGDHVRVRDGETTYVMSFQSRGTHDATYVIADESLWRGPPSTRR